MSDGFGSTYKRRNVLQTAGVVLAVFVALTIAIAPAAATHGDAGEQLEALSTTQAQVNGSADITGEFVVEPIPDNPTRIRVTATFSIENAREFETYLDNGRWHDTTVESTSGFSTAPVDGGERIRLTWDGETSPATVTYTVDRPEQYREGGQFENRIASFIDGGDWMYVRDISPAGHSIVWDSNGGGFSTATSIDTDQSVVNADGLFFVGDHEQFVETGGGTEFRIIVPPSADLRPAPIEIARILANASAEIPTEPTTDNVYVFVSGGPRKDVSEAVDTTISIDDEFDIVGYADDDAPSARNTWIHEYFHIRQTYDPLGERIKWFSEGSADYYMMLFSLHQNRLSYETFMLNLRDGDVGRGQQYMDDTLADEKSWDRLDTQYEKGRRVLAALDVKIRRATDGERTLMDVFVRMTERDGQITYPEFKTIVADVAGQSFDSWLDRHVTTGRAPTVPDTPAHYISTVDGWDSDDDGVPDQRETEVGTHPFVADTDEDGIPDSEEIQGDTDPLQPNTPTPSADPTPTASEDTATQNTPSPTETARPGETPTATPTPTGASGPGFGIGTALAALLAGLLVWRATR